MTEYGKYRYARSLNELHSPLETLAVNRNLSHKAYTHLSHNILRLEGLVV